MESGQFFASLQHDSTIDTTRGVNAQRYLKVGGTIHLVLKRFNLAESEVISFGLTRPSEFYFSGYGNVRCAHPDGSVFEFQNPLDANSRVDYDESLQTSADHPTRQFKFDAMQVISKNLKYILYKQNAHWHLLYNALHSAPFQKYYDHEIAQAPRHNIQFGATTLARDKHLSLKRVFQRYCDAFRVQRSDGKTSFLDPTCNMFYSDTQCKRSSLFEDSMVDYDEFKVNAASKTLSTLGAGRPPACLCVGNPVNYAYKNVGTQSFVHSFQKPSGTVCDNDIVMETNQNILTAREIHLNNSVLNAGGAVSPLESSNAFDAPEAASRADDGGGAVSPLESSNAFDAPEAASRADDGGGAVSPLESGAFDAPEATNSQTRVDNREQIMLGTALLVAGAVVLWATARPRRRAATRTFKK